MQREKARISLYLDNSLTNKVYKLSKQTKKSISDITREALVNYIDDIEKSKLEEELEKGYKANYDYYLKQQDEWKHADSE